MNNQKEIAQLLTQSNLSGQQSAELTVLFAKAEDDDLSPIIELLTQDISWAEKLYRNYSAKKDALDSSDDEKWQNIFREEAAMLKNLDK